MLGYRREVSAANTNKTPIIPLKMDAEMPWPPAEPMRSILGQLQYIDFCEPNEAVQNDSQYNELIKRIEQEFWKNSMVNKQCWSFVFRCHHILHFLIVAV